MPFRSYHMLTRFGAFPLCGNHSSDQFLNWSVQLSTGQLHFIVQIVSYLLQKKKDIHSDVLFSFGGADPI